MKRNRAPEVPLVVVVAVAVAAAVVSQLSFPFWFQCESYLSKAFLIARSGLLIFPVVVVFSFAHYMCLRAPSYMTVDLFVECIPIRFRTLGMPWGTKQHYVQQ